MNVLKGKATNRQKAVLVALKFDLAEFKELRVSDVHYAIEQDRSRKIFDLTGIAIGDISVSSVRNTLKQLPISRRRLPGKFGTVYTNPFFGESQ